MLNFLGSDVSWGTKGDTKVSTDLGNVSTNKDSNAAEVAMPVGKDAINAMYQKVIKELSEEKVEPKELPDSQTAQEDYYRNFRTQYVNIPAITRVDLD